MKHHKFAYYAKNRKLFIRFSVVLFSSLMLILFSLFMQIRVFETKKDHNEDLYGSWYASVYDVTKENENMLYDHQMARFNIMMNMRAISELLMIPFMSYPIFH